MPLMCALHQKLPFFIPLLYLYILNQIAVKLNLKNQGSKVKYLVQFLFFLHLGIFNTRWHTNTTATDSMSNNVLENLHQVTGELFHCGFYLTCSC